MHYHPILIAAIVPLSLAFTGCGRPQTQQDQLTQAAEKRGIDLTRTLVVAEEMKFADEAELTALCESFMTSFGRGDVDQAFAVLRDHCAWTENEMDALRETTKHQLALIGPRYGKFIGHELIESRPVGESLVRYVYLAKLENNPLRCIFIFYRPADKWIVNSFFWDDKFIQLWGPSS